MGFQLINKVKEKFMSNLTEATATTLTMDDIPGLTKRLSVLVYGVFSYSIGVGGLMWIILAMGGLAPAGFSPLQTSSNLAAMLINVALIILFGLQHSIMARTSFKQRLKQILPEAAERSTYVLLSGVFMAIAIYFWQPLPGMIWNVENTTAQVILWSAYAIGWGYLFVATFVTNHFELMGLRQVYLYFTNQPYSKLPFTKKYMYRYSRHPMMLGVLIGMWALPMMSVSHFVMSILLTIYIVIGVILEERDLIRQFGNTYHQYRKQIATLIPRVF
jgi:protein-S-isoprenylcysteine O-methyltransferase Ste14